MSVYVQTRAQGQSSPPCGEPKLYFAIKEVLEEVEESCNGESLDDISDEEVIEVSVHLLRTLKEAFSGMKEPGAL